MEFNNVTHYEIDGLQNVTFALNNVMFSFGGDTTLHKNYLWRLNFVMNVLGIVELRPI